MVTMFLAADFLEGHRRLFMRENAYICIYVYIQYVVQYIIYNMIICIHAMYNMYIYNRHIIYMCTCMGLLKSSKTIIDVKGELFSLHFVDEPKRSTVIIYLSMPMWCAPAQVPGDDPSNHPMSHGPALDIISYTP